MNGEVRGVRLVQLAIEAAIMREIYKFVTADLDKCWASQTLDMGLNLYKSRYAFRDRAQEFSNSSITVTMMMTDTLTYDAIWQGGTASYRIHENSGKRLGDTPWQNEEDESKDSVEKVQKEAHSDKTMQGNPTPACEKHLKA